MKYNDLKRLKFLIEKGYRKEIICERLNICEKTYYNNLQRINALPSAPNNKKIDFVHYYNAVMKGYRLKTDLAAYLGISNKTLINYEQRGAIMKIARYLFIRGKSNSEIAGILHTGETTVKGLTNGLVSFDYLQDIIRKIIIELEQVSDIDVEITSTISKLQKLEKALF